MLAKVSADFQEMTFEIQHLKTIVESLMDGQLQSFNALTGVIAVSNSKSMIYNYKLASDADTMRYYNFVNLCRMSGLSLPLTLFK